MRGLIAMLLLPLRAPLLLVLLLASFYLGLHWSAVMVLGRGQITPMASSLFWPVQMLQALVVVVVCTMPDLLLQRLSMLMAASRVASLVVSLLAVTVGGLYLLHLSVLADVLILSSAVLLARLDLVRIRCVPPPLLAALGLSLWVGLGVWLGWWLHPWLGAVG
ncbi:MAG: hypothetical protein R6W06_14020 [Prochlorococcaceae cyanobacterium]